MWSSWISVWCSMLDQLTQNDIPRIISNKFCWNAIRWRTRAMAWRGGRLLLFRTFSWCAFSDVRVLPLKTGWHSVTNVKHRDCLSQRSMYNWLPWIRFLSVASFRQACIPRTISWLKISVYKLILEFGSQPEFLKNLLIRSAISSMDWFSTSSSSSSLLYFFEEYNFLL
jgi:hypothetical protein